MTMQLQSLQLVAPAHMGLNKDFSGTLLGPEWAVDAENAVFDESGRLSSRKGWKSITPTPLAAHIEQAFEYRKPDGTTEIIFASNGKLYRDAETPEDITGTVNPLGNRWQFMNYNGKVIGVQFGHKPIVYDGSWFVEVPETSGTAPRGDVGLAAFGRLWIVDSDGETIKYSGLLSERDWGSSGSGVINMRRVWTKGADKVVALAALGSTLIVFGTRHIIMWVDGSGSELGMDPAQMYVVDTVEGTGSICRDSVQVLADGDVLFLSNYGLQSLKRVIQNKNNPLISVAPQVLNHMAKFINDENLCLMRSVYSPRENFYLLSLPQSNRTLVFDTRTLASDGMTRVTEWTNFAPRAFVVTDTNDLLFGFVGEFGKYDGYLDDDQSYRFVYRSGWMDFGQDFKDRLKILKSLEAVIHASINTSIIFGWAYDFSTEARKKSINFAAEGTDAEWNVSEWGIGEWSGGLRLHKPRVASSGKGQFVQISFESQISGAGINLQNVTIKAKIGRMV